MQAFTYYSPTKIIFGKEAQKKTAACIRELQVSRVLIVYGSERVVKTGLMEQVTKELDAESIRWETLGGVVANPRVDLTREGVRRAIAMQAQLILAIGGGSVIDTAKGIAAGAANPGTDIWEYWSGKKRFTKSLPVGSILTIAAAGSETSNSAVLTNDDTLEKRGVTNERNRPVFAIMNPELTYSLPRYQVAAGVTDIIMHTLERYFTPWQGNHMSDAIAEGLIGTMLKYGAKGVENTHDYEAMSEIMWAGSLSHIDLTGLGCEPPGGGRLGDWGTHQLGMEIGGMYDLTHGATLSAVWGSWARYVCDADDARFAQLGRNVFQIAVQNDREAAMQTIDAMEAFFRSIGMPTCFTELGIGVLPEEQLRKLADNCSFHHTRTISCFKTLDAEDMYKIYKMSNH